MNQNLPIWTCLNFRPANEKANPSVHWISRTMRQILLGVPRLIELQSKQARENLEQATKEKGQGQVTVVAQLTPWR